MLNNKIYFVDINVINEINYNYYITAVDTINQESGATARLNTIPSGIILRPPEIINIIENDTYLSINIKLNSTSVVNRYILYSSRNNINYAINNNIYNNYYVINLPIKNWDICKDGISLGFKTDEIFTYDCQNIGVIFTFNFRESLSIMLSESSLKGGDFT